MVTIRSAREIDCDAAVLEQVVLDWSQDARWRGAVLGIEVQPSGPAAPGQRITERLRFAGTVFTTPTEITASGRELAVVWAEFAGGSRSVTVSGRRQVRAIGAGRSEVSQLLELRLTGAGSPLTRLLAPAYRRRAESDLAALAALMESRRDAPTGPREHTGPASATPTG